MKKKLTSLIFYILIIASIVAVSLTVSISAETQSTDARDDSAFIQNLIDNASPNEEGIKIVKIPSVNPNDPNGGSTYLLSNAIVLSSNTTVILDNCTLRLNDGVVCNIFISEGCYESKMTVDDELKNISIIGNGNAILDGGNHNGVTEKTPNGYNVRYNTSIHLRNVNGFTIEGITVKEPRYWGITLIFCRYGTLSNIDFDCSNEAPNQDGIDLRHGCNNIDITGITGVTGDDVVALTTITGERQYNVEGKNNDIHDVNIADVKAACKGGHGIIRLLCHNGYKLYNVNITDVEDTGSNHVYGVLRIGDTAYADGGTSMEYGDMYNISVDGVISNGKYAILAPNTNVTTAHVDYKNVTVKYSSGKLTNLKTDAATAPLETLSGCNCFYSFAGGSKKGWTYNNNDIRTVTGMFLGKSSAYTMWPIGTDRPSGTTPLELTCSINGDTTQASSLRIQLLLAHRKDPEPGLLRMYYSTDNGNTWSTEAIKLTLALHSEKWSEDEDYIYDVWSYTSEDLAQLTDEKITNIMIHPYGDSGKETVGAFRMISFSLVGEHMPLYVDYTPPTATTSGNVAYWECDVCHSTFTDRDCSTSIDNVTIPPAGTDSPVDKSELQLLVNLYANGITQNFAAECKEKITNSLKNARALLNNDSASAEEIEAAILLLKHDAISYTYFDEEQHTHKCSCGVSASESHKLDAGKVELSPTVYEEGVMLYACSVCEAEVRKAIPKVDLYIYSAKLNIAESINVVFISEVKEGLENPYLIVSMLGKEYMISEYTVRSDGRYEFIFRGATPADMTEVMTATLYANSENTIVSSEKQVFSIKEYCKTLLEKNSTDAKLKTLVSDILTYGAELQKYVGQEDKELATDGISNLTPSRFESSPKNDLYISGDHNGNIWHGASLVCSGRMSIAFTFECEDPDNTFIKISVAGREAVYKVSDLDKDANGIYTVRFFGIMAYEFDEVITAEFIRGGTAAGEKIEFSVNSYISIINEIYTDSADSTDVKLLNLVRAIFCYGNSAKAYFEQAKGE